jgi:hypothetical protein
VQAADVRRMLFAILPEAHLTDGSLADPWANRGIEIFPKQDRIAADGVGNMVWLPWWHGATEGGNLFYRFDVVGELTPYTPDDFATVSAAELALALGQVNTPTKAHLGADGHVGSARPLGARVPTDTLMQCALARAQGTRNDAGFWLACQLRDNGYSKNEARPVVQDYQARVLDRGDHQYTEGEALASLDQAFSRPPRQPWSPAVAGPQAGDEAPQLTDLGNAHRLVAARRADLRYCFPWGTWLAWDSRRWADDDTGAVARFAKETVRGLYRWAANQIARLNDGGDDE